MSPYAEVWGTWRATKKAGRLCSWFIHIPVLLWAIFLICIMSEVDPWAVREEVSEWKQGRGYSCFHLLQGGRQVWLHVGNCFFDLLFIALVIISSVQLLSIVRLFATPWTTAPQVSLSITNSWSLHTLMSIESVMLSKHLILCHPLLLPPSIFASIRVFLLSPFFESGGQIVICYYNHCYYKIKIIVI